MAEQHCPRIESCPLFAQFSMKSSLKIWQAYYCDGDYGRCERWRRVSGSEPVPVNLLPNGKFLDVPLEQLEAKHLT